MSEAARTPGNPFGARSLVSAEDMSRADLLWLLDAAQGFEGVATGARVLQRLIDESNQLRSILSKAVATAKGRSKSAHA